MLFNSFHYFIFFPVIVLTYFLLRHRYRWFFLLLASCYFYAVFIPQYIIVLFFLILVDYLMGILIEKKQGSGKKIYLIASIIANASILFFFKYFNFFNANLAEIANFLHWNYSIKNLSFLLPVGLSFHTFQSLSYVIEVYRGRQKAERHLGVYALYVMFFPQLVAGPIERPQNLLHQFREERVFDPKRATAGLQMIIWGLFKKMVIADNLALVVNNIYSNVGNFNSVALSTAVILFAFQIYCDFSGYSSIAIGSAKILGIDLMVNFKRPYFSASISEFWTRWHISLSSWFRDYVYIPLGGNRVSKIRNYFNILITFLLSGLWHGANWTYIIWGGINGLYLIIEKMRLKTGDEIKKIKAPRFLKVSLTFILICLTWVFFRADSLKEAILILRKIFDLRSWYIGLQNWHTTFSGIFLSYRLFWVIIVSLLVLMAVDLKMEKDGKTDDNWISYFFGWRKRFTLYALVVAILFFGYFGAMPFIYFQF